MKTLLSLLAVALGCSSSSLAPDAGAQPPEVDAAPADADDGAEAAPPGIAPDETAGARLRPIYVTYDAADGASWRAWKGWYDATRDEPCGVQKMSDGKLHCAPFGEEPVFVPDSSFADPACTSPIIGVGSWNASPILCSDPTPPPTRRYFRLTSRADVCAPTRLVEFPKASPLVLTQAYYKGPSGCQAVPLTGGTFEIYAAQLPLVEVSPSSFVAFDARESTGAAPSRLRTSRIAYTGADGAKRTSPGRVVDSKRNELCTPRTAADGVLRCMPYGGDVESYEYSDPACTQHAFTVANNGNCPTDDGLYTFWSYMEQVDTAACYRVRLYPRFTGGLLSTVYYGKPGTCAAEDVSKDWYTHYAAPALPAPIEATEFASIATGTREASGLAYGKPGSRLHLTQQVTTGDDGFELRSAYLVPFDTRKNVACYPYMLRDGNFYCAPERKYFDFDSRRGDLYADPGCTRGVYGIATGDTNGCGATGIDTSAFYSEGPVAFGNCEATRIYRLPNAPPLANPTLYTRTPSNTCVPATVDPKAYAFFARSDCVEVLPADLVQLEISLVR